MITSYKMMLVVLANSVAPAGTSVYVEQELHHPKNMQKEFALLLSRLLKLASNLAVAGCYGTTLFSLE